MRSGFRIIAATLVCALIGLTVAACSSGDDNTKTAAPTVTQTQSSGGGNTSAATSTTRATAAPAGAVDACSVLTSAEISAVVNETVGDGIPKNNSPKYDCEWDSVNGLTAVYLTIYAPASAAAAASEYGLLDSGSEAVSGLGDKAHWVAQIDTLEVLKGNRNVMIQVVDLKAGSDAKTEATTLAPKALARLP